MITPHRGYQADMLLRPWPVARGRSSHLTQGSTSLKTKVENLGRGFAQLVATIDNCRRGEWILSCFFARCSGETVGTDAPTRHTGMRPPVSVFAKVDAHAAQDTNPPVNQTQGLIDIPKLSFAQDGN